MAGDDVSTVAGVVAETMNSGGYTYARLTGSGNDLWIAATEMPLTVGEAVTAAVSMPMQNFHSRTLNRDFLLVYFVGQVARNGEALSTPAASASGVAMASSHAPAAAPGAASSAELGGRPAAARAPEAATVTAPMAPAPGGHTVADLWAKRRALSGTIVIVRGQVVKRNNEIMGKNWFHLQDGTGKADTGTHDLTITTGDMVNVGDVVTVTGTLLTNQNFGAGYAYDVMLENALVKK